MKHQFGVTIGSDLSREEINNLTNFPYVSVLDLRRCDQNGPRPIEEMTLRRLANFRVSYHQTPMSLRVPDRRRENELFLNITEKRGNVLVLTDEPVQVARFCQGLDIPFSSKDLYLVETASDYVPVQQKTKSGRIGHFGSLAS